MADSRGFSLFAPFPAYPSEGCSPGIFLTKGSTWKWTLNTDSVFLWIENRPRLSLHFVQFGQGDFCCGPVLMTYPTTPTHCSSSDRIILSASDTPLIHRFTERWWIPYFITLAPAPLFLNHPDYSCISSSGPVSKMRFVSNPIQHCDSSVPGDVSQGCLPSDVGRRKGRGSLSLHCL